MIKLLIFYHDQILIPVIYGCQSKKMSAGTDLQVNFIWVSSDTSLTYERITTVCQKRRNVEVFHKSLKSNTSLSKSPTKTVRTQSNHFFASIYSFFKPEKFKIKHNLNHFSLRTKLYVNALKAGFQKLQELKA